MGECLPIAPDSQFALALEAAPTGMLVVDPDGRIVLANSRLEAIFGYGRGALIGCHVEQLLPARVREAHVSWRQGFAAAPVARPMGHGRDLVGRRSDDTEVPVEIGLNPLVIDGRAHVIGSVVDITSRREAERSLRALVAEKDALLREVHHRVKNNLAVISSLLYLQAAQTTEAAAARVLEESRSRIRAMVAVHELLYRSDDFAAVDFAVYASDLARQVIGAQALPGLALTLEIEAEPVPLGIDRAVPVALVLNELLTNCTKHAFTGVARGTVTVSLQREGDNVVLLVSDDGRGGAPAAGGASEGLGLRLIGALAHQVDGTFTLDVTGTGTNARLLFPAGTGTLRPGDAIRPA